MVLKHIQKLHFFFESFSVPGCACHDFHWIWISNDFPEEIRVECRVTQHVMCCRLPSMVNPGYRIFSLA